jgi:hypothetical protein
MVLQSFLVQSDLPSLLRYLFEIVRNALRQIAFGDAIFGDRRQFQILGVCVAVFLAARTQLLRET